MFQQDDITWMTHHSGIRMQWHGHSQLSNIATLKKATSRFRSLYSWSPHSTRPSWLISTTSHIHSNHIPLFIPPLFSPMSQLGTPPPLSTCTMSYCHSLLQIPHKKEVKHTYHTTAALNCKSLMMPVLLHTQRSHTSRQRVNDPRHN